MLCLNYALSVLRLQRACAEAGLRLDFHLRRGDSLVTRCRNDCIAYFLANPQFTHLFFIDAGYWLFSRGRLSGSCFLTVYPLKREDWHTQGVPSRHHEGHGLRRSTPAIR